MLCFDKISAFRERAVDSPAFPRVCAGVRVAAEILVCVFFAGLILAPALFKTTAFVALALFLFARFFRVPAATFPRFSRADLIFLGAICLCWILLFVAETGLWAFGVNEKIPFFRDLKNALRIIVPVFVFCRLSKKAILPCLFVAAAGIAIFAGAEYWETGTRVGLGFNQNGFSAFGAWVIFPALYFCEKSAAGTGRMCGWIARGAAAAGAIIAAFGGSRAGFLAILCGLLFYAVAGTLPRAVAFSEKRTRAFTALGVAAILCAVSLLPNLALNRVIDFPQHAGESEELVGKMDTFSSGRIQILKCSWRAITEMEHPIFGVGENLSELPAYRELPDSVRMPHNTTLTFWLTHGALGLGAALIFQISGFLLSFSEMRNCSRSGAGNGARERFLRAVLVGALWTTFVVWGFFDVPHSGRKILFWASLAFLFFAPNFEKN